MTQFPLHFGFNPEKNPLKGGGNFVFARRTPSTPGGGTTPATSDTTGGTPTTPTPPRVESLSEEQPNEQLNSAHAHKLDSLSARGVIHPETVNEAKKALRSPTEEVQNLAKMLAAEEIGEDAFNSARDALQGNKTTQKALARRLIQHRIQSDTFVDALGDLDDRDRYLRPLAQQLATGRINDLDYNRARHFMYDTTSDARDERHAAQVLALGSISAVEYRQRVNIEIDPTTGARIPKGMITPSDAPRPEHQKDPVGNVRDDIHSQIVHLLEQVGITIEALPERERTQPIKKLQQNLDNLNGRDKNNRDGMAGLLRKAQEDHDIAKQITDEEMGKILDFDVEKIPDDLDRLENEILVPMGKFNNTEIANIRTYKLEEYHIERDFIAQAKTAEEIIKVAVNFLTSETLKEFMRLEASKSTGITLKEGIKIQYVHPDAVHGNLQTVTIKKVTVEEAPILDRQDNTIGTQPANIVVELSDGQAPMPLGRFMKWVNAMDAYETVANKRDLETKLRLTEVGMELQGGQIVEYTESESRPDANGVITPNRQTVKIERITDDRVVLSEPVITLRAEEDPHLTGNRQAREMSLGEFLKWARRHDMVPEIPNLTALREYLGHYNKITNTEKGRDASLYPPLPVQNGDYLLKHGGINKNSPYKIKDVSDTGGVNFDDGTHMNLPTFFGWVRDNDVVSGNPEDLARREQSAAARIGEPPKPPDDNKDNTKKGWWQNFLEGIKTSDANPFSITKDKPYGPIQEMWNEYMFLSVADLIGLGKAIIEFIKRKHQARSKMRYSELGKYLPPKALGTEMERINQSAETEEVKQYQDAMKQWGTWQVLEKLHTTNSRFEAKACFITLTEKGELRWDDMEMWGCLNRLTSSQTTKGASLYIHKTKELQMDPKTGRKMSGEDRTKDAIDALYGEGQWAEWFSKNISSYNNNKNAYEFKGKQLEADPKGTGGLTGEMERLLSEWKKGKYVNPQEYEELIDFAIKYGKMSAESKMFYLMEGVTAKAPPGTPYAGMTLLHMDRIGDLDGKYLNQFPLIDFFTDKGEKPFHPKYLSGEYKELKDTKRGYTVEDLESFRDAYFGKFARDGVDESKKCKDGKNFSRFLWELMVVSPSFRTRLSKGVRMAQNMDHDDAHFIIAPSSVAEIDQLTGKQGGTQSYFTTEGWKNGYPGFNQYMVSLSNRYDELEESEKQGMPIKPEHLKDTVNQMVDGLKSYFLFDSFMSGRREPTANNRARLDVSHYRDTSVVDRKTKVELHKKQMDNLIKAVCEAYGIPWKTLQLYDEVEYGNPKQQEAIKNNMQEFLDTILPNAIRDHPQKAQPLIDVLRERKYRAVDNKNRDDPNALKGIESSNRLIPEGT